MLELFAKGHDRMIGKWRPVAVIVVGLVALACVSCKRKHEHVISNAWTGDAERHWHEASCGHDVRSDEDEHDFGEWVIESEPGCVESGSKKHSCIVCGYTQFVAISPKGHSFDSVWASDSASHWHPAVCGHNVVSGKASHVRGDDGKCLICGRDLLIGALSGIFTTSPDGKRVRFSKGSLYHVGDEASLGWAFEDNQYDFRTWAGFGAVIGGVSGTTPDGHVGLFYWSKDAAAAFADDYDGQGSATSDVSFVDSIESIIGSGWRLLSVSEWDYLTSGAGDRKGKLGLAVIRLPSSASVCGMVILPDDWSLPDGCGFVSGKAAGFESNAYDLQQWGLMENAGAVFIPASGYRYGSVVNDVGSYGECWTGTPSSDDDGHAWYLHFDPENVAVNDSGRNCGVLMRLAVQV